MAVPRPMNADARWPAAAAGWLGACLALPALGAEATSPSLSLPIACEVGKTCFVQNYVDIDPGPGARDYACGSATYEGHKGTDIRLLSTRAAKAGVAVVAAADGVISGARDGETDIFASEGGRDAIQGRECGNGVVIDHGGGWETQYCHMRKGSVRLKTGATVQRGDQLGEVGWSGFADFAHLHFSVRHAGTPVDPFTAHGMDGACVADTGSARGLWTSAAAQALAYRSAEILGAEISDRMPAAAELEHDHTRLTPATPDSDALLLGVRAIKMRAGDVVRLELVGPGGLRVEGGKRPLPKDKATYIGCAGIKRPKTLSRWPGGRYEGHVSIERNGQLLSERRVVREL